MDGRGIILHPGAAVTDPSAPPFPRRLLHVLHIWILQEEFREGAFGAVVLYSSPLRFSVVGRKLLKNNLTRADRCALVFRDHVLEEFFFSTYASRILVHETTVAIGPREKTLEEFPFLCTAFEDVLCLLPRYRRHCGPATWVLEEFVARRRHCHETTVAAAPRRQTEKLLKLLFTRCKCHCGLAATTFLRKRDCHETTVALAPRETKLEEFLRLSPRYRRHCGPATLAFDEFVGHERHCYGTTLAAAPQQQTEKLLKFLLTRYKCQCGLAATTFVRKRDCYETTVALVPRETTLEEFLRLSPRCRRHCGHTTWAFAEFLAH